MIRPLYQSSGRTVRDAKSNQPWERRKKMLKKSVSGAES